MGGRLSPAGSEKIVPPNGGEGKETSCRWQSLPLPPPRPTRPRNFLPPEERENEGCLQNVLVPSAAFGGD